MKRRLFSPRATHGSHLFITPADKCDEPEGKSHNEEIEEDSQGYDEYRCHGVSSKKMAG